jgi:hypothetical protein
VSPASMAPAGDALPATHNSQDETPCSTPDGALRDELRLDSCRALPLPVPVLGLFVAALAAAAAHALTPLLAAAHAAALAAVADQGPRARHRLDGLQGLGYVGVQVVHRVRVVRVLRVLGRAAGKEGGAGEPVPAGGTARGVCVAFAAALHKNADTLPCG